jgi:hypothetical protein
MHYIVYIKSHTNFHSQQVLASTDVIFRKFSLTALSPQRIHVVISATLEWLKELDIRQLYERDLKLTDRII